MNFDLSEVHRQAVLLAIAKLSLSRPGWDHMLAEIAEALRGSDLYRDFKSHGPEYSASAAGEGDRGS